MINLLVSVCHGADVVNIDQLVAGGSSITNIGTLLTTVVRFLFEALGLVAFIVILISGYMFVTAGGDEKKAGTAKKTLTYAIVGVIVVMMAYAIVTIVGNPDGWRNILKFRVNPTTTVTPTPTPPGRLSADKRNQLIDLFMKQGMTREEATKLVDRMERQASDATQSTTVQPLSSSVMPKLTSYDYITLKQAKDNMISMGLPKSTANDMILSTYHYNISPK